MTLPTLIYGFSESADAARSVEVERGPDRLCECGFLLCQQEPQLASERTNRHRDDVVATDNAVVIEPVSWTHRHLRGQAPDAAGDGRDSDPAEVGAHDLTGEDQHRSCFVQACGMNGSHQSSSSIDVAAAYSARLSRSVSVPALARMAASRSATLRRRSRSRARDTTAARLVASPRLTRSSTKATRSSGRRMAIWVLIPERYHNCLLYTSPSPRD